MDHASEKHGALERKALAPNRLRGSSRQPPGRTAGCGRVKSQFLRSQSPQILCGKDGERSAGAGMRSASGIECPRVSVHGEVIPYTPGGCSKEDPWRLSHSAC